MDPSVYIPAYLERTYLASHPELTDAARELVHNDISANPQKYAQSEHAQATRAILPPHVRSFLAPRRPIWPQVVDRTRQSPVFAPATAWCHRGVVFAGHALN